MTVIPKASKPSGTGKAQLVIPKFSLEQYRVDLDVEVKQEVIFRIQDRIALTKKSLLVITGKPKARKSTFLHTFIAAVLKQDRIWQIESFLPAEQSVVLIDTEQSLFDLSTSLNRLARTISLPLSKHPRFAVYSARSLDVQQIQDLIIRILEETPQCGLLCLDGLLDLVNDINDVKESKGAIQFIKKICDDRNIGIIGIIHQNKGTNFSLGHLGAFASRFCQSELNVVKNEDQSSTMSSTFMRSSEDIEPIQISWDSTHSRYDMTRNIMPPMEPVAINLITREALQGIFAGRSAVTYRDLVGLTLQAHPELTKYQVEKKIVPVWYAENLLTKRGNLIQITLEN